MVITYCDRCGDLIRTDNPRQIEDLCSACASGTQHKAIRTRDSGQIPYALRPSSGAILRDIKQNVRRD